MYIKEIKSLKEKCSIAFDNGTSLKIYKNVVADNLLYKGKKVDDSLISKIKEDNQIEEYFSFISKKLIVREYSPNKIFEMLYKEGANKNQSTVVINRLKRCHLLCEEKLVEVIVDRCDRRHLGYNKVLIMLKDKKISQKEVNKIKYDINREYKEAKLQTNILLRKYKNKNSYELKRNVYSGLIRNGFSEEIANEISSDIKTYNHINEINVLKLDYRKYLSKYSTKYKGNELNNRIVTTLLKKGYRIDDIKEIQYEMDKRIG